MSKLGLAAVALVVMAGCGAQVADTSESPSAEQSTAAPAPCPPSYPDAGTASVQATAEMTECLQSQCVGIGSCATAPADFPHCVQEESGGQLLAMYGCP